MKKIPQSKILMTLKILIINLFLLIFGHLGASHVLMNSIQNKDLIIVGPSFGDKANTNEVVKKLNIKYDVFLAGSDEVEFMEENGNADFKLPHTILLDPKKNQTFSKIGILKDKDFELIKKNLNE